MGQRHLWRVCWMDGEQISAGLGRAHSHASRRPSGTHALSEIALACSVVPSLPISYFIFSSATVCLPASLSFVCLTFSPRLITAYFDQVRERCPFDPTTAQRPPRHTRCISPGLAGCTSSAHAPRLARRVHHACPPGPRHCRSPFLTAHGCLTRTSSHETAEHSICALANTPSPAQARILFF